MINPQNLPEHLQRRYGVRASRWRATVTGIVLTGLLLGGLGFIVLRHKNPTLAWRLDAFKVQSANEVAVKFTVDRHSGATSYCVIRAQDDRRADVGYATVAAPQGQGQLTMVYPLATDSLAVLAEVLGCSTQIQQRVPGPNFPPGVKIPAQPSPGVAPIGQ